MLNTPLDAAAASDEHDGQEARSLWLVDVVKQLLTKVVRGSSHLGILHEHEVDGYGGGCSEPLERSSIQP